MYCFCQPKLCFLYAPLSCVPVVYMWEKLMECSLAPFSSVYIMAGGVSPIPHAVLPCERSGWSAPWLHPVVSELWLVGSPRYPMQCYHVRKADGVLPIGFIQWCLLWQMKSSRFFMQCYWVLSVLYAMLPFEKCWWSAPLTLHSVVSVMAIEVLFVLPARLWVLSVLHAMLME